MSADSGFEGNFLALFASNDQSVEVGRTQEDMMGLLGELKLETYAQYKEGRNYFVDDEGKAQAYKDDEIPGAVREYANGNANVHKFV